MGDNENQNIREQAKQLQEEVRQLRDQLNSLNVEKEALFSKKEEVSKKIRTLISEVVSQKKERNQLTDSVHDVKVERQRLNTEITNRIKNLTELKQKIPAQRGEDPEKIIARINILNTKIETEVMPFSKEQELTKQIKDLKKKYNQASTSTASIQQYKTASNEIRDLRLHADSEHQKIQTVAKESQAKHYHILEQSKVIDTLKEEEKASLAQFLSKKEEFNKVNQALKDKLLILSGLKGKLGTTEKEHREENHRKNVRKLEEKKRDAEEKLKKGAKLTTEDLIALQGSL